MNSQVDLVDRKYILFFFTKTKELNTLIFLFSVLSLLFSIKDTYYYNLQTTSLISSFVSREKQGGERK